MPFSAQLMAPPVDYTAAEPQTLSGMGVVEEQPTSQSALFVEPNIPPHEDPVRGCTRRPSVRRVRFAVARISI